MKLQAVIDLVRPLLIAAAPGPQWKDVREADEAENFIGQAGTDLPVALVHHWSKEAGQVHGVAGAFRQATVERFAIVIVCDKSEVDQRQRELAAALHGKQLDQATYPYLVHYTGGSIFELKAGRIAWREIYQTQVDRSQTA